VDETSPLRRDSFKTVIPISMPVSIPPPTRAFSEVEWLTLESGHRARDMDDKRFSFVEHDRLFLHRSWTGHGLFECQFESHEGHWTITGAVVEGDLTVYRRDGHSDDYESQLLERIILRVLLGVA
jgi:hypothetical protein